MEKYRLEKVQKYVFYKHTNIVTKKSEEKTQEKIFPKTHEYGKRKMLKKNRLKKVRKKCFFINT